MLRAVLKNHTKNSYSENSPGIESQIYYKLNIVWRLGRGKIFYQNFTEVNYYKDPDQQDTYLALLCLSVLENIKLWKKIKTLSKFEWILFKLQSRLKYFYIVQ